jgi:hypothetical protein
VGLHAALGEEPECLTSSGVFLDAEDLYFHDANEARDMIEMRATFTPRRAQGNLRL